ncbi:NUDIX domain-containing protein [Candidatus Bathyarchaeota archaeon]|nr:NUDIX domain-containing protein [Candidatus Bathyarchaeota archaeon]NIU80776.1 NUDIX domain-containing protein [Candidatus Bathyarchaeota archaeon]NIV67401.1 NUDIX domain-containing protein [Candidatus Bathyarchaeota archaeon]NIW15945.1 NUDIX domain-containing protein [Candidatus Bathyarchaeota archaeon]NIW34047.1 NUDIX domain-containing protein [Candidatus Bathyarchaeota archaeon]
MPRERSCGAVVFRKNGEPKYLLLHYEAGHWGFVKGEVEAGESAEETARRELEEETGITDSHFIGDFREKINYFYRRGGETVYKEVTYFLAQVKSSAVELSYEHVGYAWLTYQRALQRLTFQNAKDVLRKAHRFLKKTT